MTTVFQIECLESVIKNPRQIKGKFLVEPLPKGQGITLGNAMRRVLLSCLKGLSIVAVRISGIKHEFSTLPGVREDILEILLNLKDIVLKGHINGVETARLKVHGPAIITASQIEISSNITIVDPCQYIATISKNYFIEMELRIEEGFGYRLATPNKSSSDFLLIDSVFMPVIKVNYCVRENISNSLDISEKLILEIITNGSLTPQVAINHAAIILTQLFSPFRTLNFKKSVDLKIDNNNKLGQILIEELDLSVRAYNCLKRCQINTLGDLLQYSQEELLGIKNFGQKSAEEVIQSLYKKYSIILSNNKKH
uniref:DNA-directed RNA polymerase subunit alpha n=1 Tax=Cyanidium sp. THAL103 TaxID=3027999 RepID=A0A9Y1I474_9RHOD|nr:RNA polymerase alpha subunit [Cyanidium sp. THAL103]